MTTVSHALLFLCVALAAFGEKSAVYEGRLFDETDKGANIC